MNVLDAALLHLLLELPVADQFTRGLLNRVFHCKEQLLLDVASVHCALARFVDDALQPVPGELAMLLAELAEFLPLCSVGILHEGRLLGEDVLDRQDLVEQLELLLGEFPVVLADLDAVELKGKSKNESCDLPG